jgi:hypothetical protein
MVLLEYSDAQDVKIPAMFGHMRRFVVQQRTA